MLVAVLNSTCPVHFCADHFFYLLAGYEAQTEELYP